jgi:hypothetical protein
MWITLQFANEIAQVNLDGRIIRTYRIPVPAAPHGLAIADDGDRVVDGKVRRRHRPT